MRSPLETKRPICINYVEVIESTIDFCNKFLNKYKCTVVIDGWTGSHVQDKYTTAILCHHQLICSAIRKDLEGSGVESISIVGKTFDEKAQILCQIKNESRLLSICQYGSGITFGSVLGNDMCIALHPQEFNDPILGRNGKNNVYPCTLDLDIPSTTQVSSLKKNNNYTNTIDDISSSYTENAASFYAVNYERP